MNKRPEDDINDILSKMKDINDNISKMFSGDFGIDKILDSMNLQDNVEIEINGQKVDKNDMNGELAKIMDSIFSGQIQIQPSNIYQREENRNNTKIANKNFLIIQRILEINKNKNIENIFNSDTRDEKVNDRILKENNYTDSRIFDLIEKYGFDLTKVKNIKNVLQCLMFAIKKGELVI